MNLSGTFSLFDLDAFAATVLPAFLQQKILLLYGDLGAGKTTLAKALLHKINPEIDDVQSPSFPIMIPYDTAYGKIWHMDLYRLSEEKAWQELQALGIEEILAKDLAIIEWPDRCANFFYGLCLKLDFCQEGEQMRHYNLSFKTPVF